MTEGSRNEIGSRLRGTVINGGDTMPFDKIAGQAMLMLFLGRREWPGTPAAIELLRANQDLFDGHRASFAGVMLDGVEEVSLLDAPQGPGHVWLQDIDGRLGSKFGALVKAGDKHRYLPCWLLVDIRLRIVEHVPIAQGERIFDALRDYLASDEQQAIMPAPVLMVPRLFEPELCRHLIETYEREGGKRSGFIHLVDGKPARGIDVAIKRRSDFYITDEALRKQLVTRLRRVLFPMIKKAFQFTPTMIERLNIVCYDGEEQGFFRPHRDDVTAATAHRRFACTINLNSEDYDGGELRFPEYGAQTYRPPTGGAVVFSCSLMHEALPVTRGKRYAVLPFLSDDAGQEQLRQFKASMNFGEATGEELEAEE